MNKGDLDEIIFHTLLPDLRICGEGGSAETSRTEVLARVKKWKCASRVSEVFSVKL